MGICKRTIGWVALKEDMFDDEILNLVDNALDNL